LADEPEIVPLRLAELTLPEWHPEARGQASCSVLGFAVRDGADVVLVDTGVGEGSEIIERLYAPRRRALRAALGDAGIAMADVSAVVNSHLHFDHCGGNALFPGTPITVQRAEYEAAHEPHYTVPDWVDAPGLDYRLVEGEARVTERTRVVPTPGHTPGHQSLIVDAREGAWIVVCQAAYTAAEFEAARGGALAAPPGSWHEGAYRGSLDRLHDLAPARAFFSHDPAIWLRSRSGGPT
jgi:glyoxylase-like metal-dependent hydrolase (beta-lactamase superfamily II)